MHGKASGGAGLECGTPLRCADCDWESSVAFHSAQAL